MSRLDCNRGQAVTALAAAAVVITGLAVADAAGWRVNATPSMPLGLWRLQPNATPLYHGEVVVVCLPDTAVLQAATQRGYLPPGNCPGGFEPLLKPVAAMAGDVVTVAAAGVVVNGQAVPATAQLDQDSAGRHLQPVPPGSYPVAPGEIWLLSGHNRRSFDSRYFGPVPVANVQGIAQPVWVLP